MKIKIKNCSYGEVMAKPVASHFFPRKPGIIFRALTYLAGLSELKKAEFEHTETGMERLGKKQPCLYLMNHSSFIDLKIAAHILFHKPFQIVCTQDGFIGKLWLMKRLGCIPKKKFVPEPSLIRDMIYAFQKLSTSVLMYPEASYSFDGTGTPLPDSLGRCLELLNVPVATITTQGAFSYDPLYNGLQKRKVKISANTKYLLSPEEIKEKSADELNEILRNEFNLDYFKWQQKNKVSVSEPFRVDHLERVLYKCPACGCEGETEGKGTELTCRNCGHKWTLDEYGYLKCTTGEDYFTHIPEWYAWERECVKKEIESGDYRMECDVDICIMADYKCLYRVGSGKLTHTSEGFSLTGCDGQLNYTQPPIASYSLYADYYWYEIGDMICIGDTKYLYYCFPKNKFIPVAKARIAAEELYKKAKNSAAKQ